MMTTYIEPKFDAIPAELRKLPRWVTWEAIPEAGAKDRKEPFAPDRPDTHAKVNDPDTWGTFDQAEAAYLDGGRTGVGIVLNGDGLAGVDLDHCVIDGKPSPEALALLDKLEAAYIEISPSGTGLRAIGYGEQLSAGVNGSLDGLKAEFYSTGRYLTLTGQTIKAGPIAPFKDFAKTAETFRTVKKTKTNAKTGELENVPPDARHAALVAAILSGDVYHDSLRDLAASLVATGMQAGAVVNHLRGLMDASQGPHDERWQARRGQIPELVSTACEKFALPAVDFSRLLAETVDPQTGEVTKVHPLARFVEIGDKPKPPRWALPGFIQHGVVVISGSRGAGKTTAIFPLSMVAAGLHEFGNVLAPRHWRHVVYVTEDAEQARRILAGIVGYSNLGISMEQVRERLHIVEAVRLDPAFVVTVGATYREQFTRTVEGVEVLPLVVLDTKSAVLAQENENDNSEGSRLMAALKQGFEGLPVWLIGHVSKSNFGRSDITTLTSRGADSIEADANQTLYLIKEGDTRFLSQGKTRFEPRWQELEISSYTAETLAKDEFGNLETVVMRWGVATPAQQSRKEAAEQAAERQRLEDEATLRDDIREAIETAWVLGNPLNREGIKAKLQRKNAVVVATIENLLSERWLHEVFVPAKERLHPRKSSFFLNLTTEEHEAVLRGDGLPDEKLVIPTSWRKPAVSSVPDTVGTIEEIAGFEDEQ